MNDVVVSNWDALMDSRRNPLRHLDLASQHYFMQGLLKARPAWHHGSACVWKAGSEA